NMVQATFSTTNGSGFVEFGGFRLAVPEEVIAAHPGVKAFEGKPIVLGLRPEDIEDASLVPDAPPDQRIRSVVDIREALGADVVVHFNVQAPVVITEDVKELAHDVGQEALEAVQQQAQAGQSEFLARLSPRTKAAKGEQIELVVDVTRMNFFDPETGLGVYEDAVA